MKRHRDPFDRIIIAAAETQVLEIVSVDSQFDAYSINRIWVFDLPEIGKV